MASSTHDDRYKMSNPFRGLLVIVNNEIFANEPRRIGTEKDVERLTTTFEQLGFEIKRHDNKTCVEILQIMAKVKDMSNDYDCVAVAILTHGADDNKIYGVGKDDSRHLDVILGPLKDTRKGIPKLVLIQACREENLDEGHVAKEAHDAASSAKHRPIRVPLEADFLYHFATSSEYYSIPRQLPVESIFIQELCNVFDESIKANVEIDVIKSLIEVNRRVAENYESSVTKPKEYNDKKQMPSFVCMLRKELFLKKQT